MCVIMSQCPLLATLIRSVSHIVMDSPTILLPQFSTSSVKSLLALLYTGKCALSQDFRMEFEEMKQIMKAIGMNLGTEDLEIVRASSNNNISDNNGNIKIEIEPKQEPDKNNENFRSFVSSPTPRLGSDFIVVGDTTEETGETEGAARVEVVYDISTRNHKEGRTCSIVQGVALQPQPGLVVQLKKYVDNDPWEKEFYEDSIKDEFDQMDKASVKIDIDEDLWKEEFYEDSREEKFDKDPRQEDIDSFPAVLEDEEAGGRSEQRETNYLVEVWRSARERKPFTYVVEKKIEVEHKNKFKRRVVNINRHGTNCGFCETWLNGKKELLKHLGMGLDNAYRCKVKQDMEMVKMAQNGTRKHICRECGKGFTERRGLTRHGVVHTKMRPFGCNQCNKSYSSVSNLAQHRRNVHEGVKYKCQECGKYFSGKSYMEKHIRCIHLKEKRYKCPKCGMQFGWKISLNRHMMSVHKP